MDRRRFLLGGLMLLAASGPALATERVDQIVQALRREGYTRIEISRTWLGRTRILASGGPGQREIVVQPATGEVLRDIESEEDDSGQGRGRGRGRGRGGDDNSGSGSDDSGDDDSDDSGGDDSGDDNSGHGGGDDSGGGNSGHGGGDDSGGDDD